jgi:multiple sugar transport system ATP-binding protein
MNQGIIEQIGTPNEIYHDSDTMFIAKFIGSPPANFFDVDVSLENDDIILKHDAFSYTYRGSASKTLKDHYLNKKIVLSVRPEQITIHQKKALFETKAAIIEPQGSHVIINASIGKEPFKIVSDLINLKENQMIHVGFTDQVALFDPTTEKRIR